MHIAIIGNGISGITAARHIRKNADHKITVISAETEYFFSRTALMYIYMGHMKYKHTKPYEDGFWKKNRIDLLFSRVAKIDAAGHKLVFNDGSELQWDKLIIACGSVPNKFNWPGQDLEAVQGLYSYQDLQSMEKHSAGLQRAVIVGGGLIGIEMAEMFHSRNIPVTFLVRENSFWSGVLPPEESEMVNREIRRHHIDLRLGTELKEVLPNEQGRARAVVTGKGEEIACQFVGLTAGVRPNTGFLEGSGIETGGGVLVNHYFETSCEDVYAIGDCAEFREPPAGRKPLEQVWYTGRMHGETVAQTLCGNRVPYTPGNWFNSAKFFSIEYQTYGEVPPDLPESFDSVYREHADGTKAMRVVFEKESFEVKGFNLMGVRFRHEVCDQWLDQRKTVGYVLQHLQQASFDPEFFRTCEREMCALFNRRYPEKAVQPARKKRFLERLGFGK